MESSTKKHRTPSSPLGLLSICTRRHCGRVCRLVPRLAPWHTSVCPGKAKGEWKYYCSIRARVMHKCIDREGFSSLLHFLSPPCRLSRQPAGGCTNNDIHNVRVTSNGLVIVLCLAYTLMRILSHHFAIRSSGCLVLWASLPIGNRERRRGAAFKEAQNLIRKFIIPRNDCLQIYGYLEDFESLEIQGNSRFLLYRSNSFEVLNPTNQRRITQPIN